MGYKKPKEYVVDFETITANTNYYKTNDDTRIIYWYAKNRFEEKEMGGDEAEGVSGYDFLSWLFNLKTTTHLWFHNISFDGHFILPLLEQTKLKQSMLEIEDQQLFISCYDENGRLLPSCYNVFRNGNKIYYIELKHRPKGNRNNILITMRCSYNILMSGVAGLAKAYKNDLFMGQPLQKLFDNEKALGASFYDREPQPTLTAMYQHNLEYINYCKRDVEIVRRSLNDFHKTINQIPTIAKYNKDNLRKNKKSSRTNRKNKYTGEYDVLSKGITIAGIGRTILEQIYIPYFQKYSTTERYKTNYIFNHLKESEDKFVKVGNMSHIKTNCYQWIKDNKFYRGGFTQFNPIYQQKEKKDIKDAIKLDVSSAYPYQMTYPLPYGPLIDSEEWDKHYADLNLVESQDYIEFNIYYIKKANPKPDAINCPILFNYTKQLDPNKKVQYRYNPNPQKNFILPVIKEEFDELCEWYDFEIENVETKYMFAAPFLSIAAKELYDLKEYYDKQNLPAQKNGTKVLLNSLYGSLALGLQYDNYAYVNNELFEQFDNLAQKEQTIINKYHKEQNINLSGKSPSCDLGDKHCIRFTCEITKLKSWNYAAATVITAKQRTYLFKFIRSIGAKYFAYCDTDSVIFADINEGVRSAIKKFESDKLGGWEVEKRYITQYKVRKAKEYIVEYKAFDEDKQKFYKIENNKKVYCDFNQADSLQEIRAAGHKLEGSEYKNIVFTDDYLNENITIKDSGMRVKKCRSGLVIERFDKKDRLGVV